MIIKSLYCKNFMKFRKLDLREIPEKGLIGIIGENEAGKSTIGEAISFGLFGKCTRGDMQHLHDIIFWGETEGFVQVKVCFSDEQFVLSRHFSRDGHSLGISNETLGTELNPESIQAFYRERLKLSFKEFRYSSYVAQKELAIIQSHRADRLDVINSMLGLKKLDDTEKRLGVEIEKSRGRVAEVDETLENLREALADINEELAEKKVVVNEIKVHEAEKNGIAGSIAESEKQIEHLNSFEETNQKRKLLKEKISLLEGALERQEERIQALATVDGRLREFERRLEQARALERRERLENARESLRQGHETKRESLVSLTETLSVLKEERAEIKRQLLNVESELEADKKALAELTTLKKELQENENRKKGLERDTAKATDIRISFDNSAKTKALIEGINQERGNLIAAGQEEENRIKTELGMVKASLTELGEQLAELNEADTSDNKKAVLATRRRNELLFGTLFVLSAIGLAGWIMATGVMTHLAFGAIPVIFLASVITSRAKTTKLQRELYKEIVSRNEKKGEIDDQCRAHRETKTQLEKKRAEIARISGILSEIDLADRSGVEAGMDKIRELPDNPFEFDLMRILGFFNDNKLEGALGDYHSSLAESVENLERNLEELKALEKTCSDLTNAILQLEARSASIGAHEKQMDDLKNRLGRMETEEMKLTASREALEGETEKLGREMSKLETQLQDLGQTHMEGDEGSMTASESQGNGESVDELMERVLKTRQEIDSLKKQKVDQGQLLEEKEELRRELAGLQNEFNGLEKELADAEFSQEKLNGLREQLKNYNLQMFEILEAIARKKTLLERFQDTESRKKQVSTRIQGVEEEEKQLRGNILYFPEVIKLYGQTRDNIIRKIKPQIERYFSIYLPKLTNNRYKKVSLQEDFSVRIFSDEKNDYVPLKNLSGGTEDQILLMLRLAFSKALFPAQQKGNGDLGFQQFLFLDEPISSFDQKRQSAFIELLRIMERIYQQIFVISHISELENKMDYFIRAEASSNLLEVERL